MIGTRSTAMISGEEYTSAIDDFNRILKQVAESCSCTVYGYSDNAYAEINSVEDVFKFFCTLRDQLMENHRYFTAVVDRGTLNAEMITIKGSATSYRKSQDSFSMKFVSPQAIDIYLKQCDFTGIGISLSQNVIHDMIKNQKNQKLFCQSIYQKKTETTSNQNLTIVPIFDIAYSDVCIEKIEYIISDYLIASATNFQAGRYYITPIISMIKCLPQRIIECELKKIVSLISLSDIPEVFKSLPYQREHSLYFILALIDHVLSLRDTDLLFDSRRICECIINLYNNISSDTIEQLSTIPSAIISNKNKRMFLSFLYNQEYRKNTNEKLL